MTPIHQLSITEIKTPVPDSVNRMNRLGKTGLLEARVKINFKVLVDLYFSQLIQTKPIACYLIDNYIRLNFVMEKKGVRITDNLFKFKLPQTLLLHSHKYTTG